MATNNNIVFGDVTDLRTTSKYFVDAYWTDEEDNKITEAYMGSTVRIHLQTEKIPEGEAINIKIYDYWATGFISDTHISSKPENFKIPKDGKLVLIFTLNEPFVRALNDNKWSDQLDLYLRCRYKHIAAELMNIPAKRLKVTLPERKNKVRFVSASPEQILPGIYDAKTGEIYYLAINDIKSPTPQEFEYSIKQARKDLSKGYKDVTKVAHLFYTNREYKLTIHKLTGGAMYELKKQIRDPKKRLKDIYRNITNNHPELDENGIRLVKEQGKLKQFGGFLKRNFKFGMFLRKVTYLADFAAFTIDLQNDKRTLPVPIPQFNQFWDDFDNSLTELQQQRFMDDMVDAIIYGYKDEKGVKSVKRVISDYKRNSDESIIMGYDFIPLTEKGLNAIFSGAITEIPTKIKTEHGVNLEIKEIYHLQDIGVGDPENCGILIQKAEGTRADRQNKNKEFLDEYDRIIDIYNIVGIWVPPLIIDEP